MDYIVSWESEAPETTAIVEWCDHFVARGMRRVYGRGDHYGSCSGHTFNMDIWKYSRGAVHEMLDSPQ